MTGVVLGESLTWLKFRPANGARRRWAGSGEAKHEGGERNSARARLK